MHLISSLLQQLESLTSQTIYLVVRPSVRDLLSGNQAIKDIDLVMPSGSEDVGPGVRQCHQRSFFFLDEERRITRVVKHEADGNVQFDFTNFEGPDLDGPETLPAGFHGHAMANGPAPGSWTRGRLDGLVDLFDGREDVRQRLIRVADPRCLDDESAQGSSGAVRFARPTLGFQALRKGRRTGIRDRASLVTKPSAERG